MTSRANGETVTYHRRVERSLQRLMGILLSML